MPSFATLLVFLWDQVVYIVYWFQLVFTAFKGFKILFRHLLRVLSCSTPFQALIYIYRKATVQCYLDILTTNAAIRLGRMYLRHLKAKVDFTFGKLNNYFHSDASYVVLYCYSLLWPNRIRETFTERHSPNTYNMLWRYGPN